MNFGRLLKDNKIELVEKTEFEIEQILKDIDFAKNGLETGNYNRIMAISYETVLMAGNRLMNFLGYRAIGREHHKNTFEFLNTFGINKELVFYFDKIRIKRNNFVYRGADEISKSEAEQIIKKAEIIVQEIRTFVQEIRTFVQEIRTKGKKEI
ncbi:HEPN domain-containing protein [Candidatus Pacearchaeota archaeon]|nr:HEPN domain-containing protein [Candidatus Pacearchaeota archaeon]